MEEEKLMYKSNKLFDFLMNAKCGDEGKLAYVKRFATELRNAYFSDGYRKGMKMGATLAQEAMSDKHSK